MKIREWTKKPAEASPDDDLTLTAIWRVIRHRWRLFLIPLVLFVAGGLLSSLFVPPVYSYKTIVFVGPALTQHPRQSSKELVEYTERAIAPEVLNNFSEDQSFRNGIGNVKIKHPKNSLLLVIEQQGTISQESLLYSIQQDMANQLIAAIISSDVQRTPPQKRKYGTTMGTPDTRSHERTQEIIEPTGTHAASAGNNNMGSTKPFVVSLAVRSPAPINVRSVPALIFSIFTGMLTGLFLTLFVEYSPWRKWQEDTMEDA